MKRYPPAAPGMEPTPAGDVPPGGPVHCADVGPLRLETGGFLPEVSLAYQTWGTLNADASNAVLVEHALTGSSHAASSAEYAASGEEGWWDDLIGPGKAIDTARYFVVAANMLGGCYGSTGPSSPAPDCRPWGSRFPFLTIRDSVQAEALLADVLGIGRWHTVAGGSLGAARALEWAVMFPDRVARCAVVAGAAASTAEQIAFAQTQVAAIRLDPNFRGGDYYDGAHPATGLGIARRIAHITYRSEAELQRRFGRRAQPGEDPFGATTAAGRGRYEVESYLDYQAGKLASRFDANSYIVLTEALMSHDVARGRGSLAEALARCRSEFVVAAVDSDRLYLPGQSEELAAALPGTVEVQHISTPVGHDGFLTGAGQLTGVLKDTFFSD